MRLVWIALTCLFSMASAANVPLTEALGNGPPIPAAPKLQASGYLLVDATNGAVIQPESIITLRVDRQHQRIALGHVGP